MSGCFPVQLQQNQLGETQTLAFFKQLIRWIQCLAKVENKWFKTALLRVWWAPVSSGHLLKHFWAQRLISRQLPRCFSNCAPQSASLESLSKMQILRYHPKLSHCEWSSWIFRFISALSTIDVYQSWAALLHRKWLKLFNKDNSGKQYFKQW